ncbi:spindle and centriole-associated protein 1 isoform X1 [Ictalurus punctatus]|uniref:Spindle and centriole-associated protein 1 n=1 Tax=Ictalurus punctatus TaxID=7998 RepID=A0A979EFY3_ICTPU|nr:spindle and centriole-associated protein 1 isoform X1 [Ictalurus punctatus]XP_047006066.1 spindle and centriole-associated protein 1 isoform X1 [Ictalurus punctatus]
MSFVRINRRPVRTKKVSVPKKEWVSTVNDLSVHKSTAEELSRRHDIHRSRNRAAAQWELSEKSLKKRKSRPTSPPGLDQTRLRLFREVFSDHCELQDVLARSDRALALVKDLFGDAPRRQKGFPSVTVAPDCGSDSELPVLQKPDPPTQLSLLSQSMMDHQALNEPDDSAAEHWEDLQDVSVSFDPEMSRLKRKTCKAKPPVWTTIRQPLQQNVPQTPCNATGSEDHAALNATLAVQRLKSRQCQSEAEQSTVLVNQVLNPEPSPARSGGKSRSFRTTRGRSPEASGFSSQSANQSSLELLQDMLAQVETDLACLETQELFGPSERPELQHGRGLTGFSAALVGTLGRIVSHLRRSDEEAQKEARVRRRMEEEVKEQRSLIDALTAECLALREESAALQAILQERIAELEQRLDMVILAMGELGKDGNSQGEEKNTPSGDLQPITAERDQEDSSLISSAVLLSPPHQRDSRKPSTARTRSSLQFEGSHTPGSGSPGESDNSCAPSSFASLPESVLPRPALLLNQLSQDAVLEQIAELTRQNAAIQAQLAHNHASPTQCLDRCASPPAGPQPTQQCVGVDDSSVRLMEDRLEELNRQSAAARAKLLELIEEQRQTTSHSASPSISPIPPHSISPHTVVGRRTPEACASVPERAQPSHARTNSRRSADTVSPQNVEGRQKQSADTQVHTFHTQLQHKHAHSQPCYGVLCR